MSIETKQVNVTPEMAGKWLDRHWDRVGKGKFKQRPVSLTQIVRYAQAMKDGQWGLDPNPIVFDSNDNLMNGQHRLEAVRKSGVTITFMVSTGWPPNTMDVLDQGRNRNNAQLLALTNGYGGYASRYAGTVAVMGRVAFRGYTASLTYANCNEMLEHLNLKGNIDAIMAKSPNYLKDFQSSVVGPLAYYHTVRPGKALQFADALFNFETVKGSPVNLYLNWMRGGHFRTKDPGTKFAGMHVFQRKIAGICACLKAWDDNTTISRVVTAPSSIEWLGDSNPKLRDWCKAHISRTSGFHKEQQPGKPEEKASKDKK